MSLPARGSEGLGAPDQAFVAIARQILQLKHSKKILVPAAGTGATDSEPRFLVPLLFVTSLFFLWGLAYGLLDVLNKHFQESLQVGRADSGWLQAAYFGAYFFASFPAGRMTHRFGYKISIVVGLVLYAVGAFLFIPAATQASFVGFLGALFVLACGLSCLETAANPYVTVLGPPQTAERRLNLSQSFNGLGVFLGPLIGGAVFFSAAGPSDRASLSSVAEIYAAIGVLVLGVAIAFSRLKLPEVVEPGPQGVQATNRPLNRPHFVLGPVLFHIDHVSDHFLPRGQGFGWPDQTRFVVYGGGHCRRRCAPLCDGHLCGTHKYRTGVSLSDRVLQCGCTVRLARISRPMMKIAPHDCADSRRAQLVLKVSIRCHRMSNVVACVWQSSTGDLATVGATDEPRHNQK